jgi:Ca2+-binding RTX toxin-like protein
MPRQSWSKVAAALSLCLAAAAYASETITYSYDGNGRLVKVEHSGTVNNGTKTEYGLDKADNRAGVTVTGATNIIMGTPGDDNPLNGTSGDDTIHALAGNDRIYVHQGGNDTVYGGDGNDFIIYKTALTGADVNDGGAGTNTVIVQGNYPGLTLGSGTMVNMASMSIRTSQENTWGGGSGSPSILFSYNMTSLDSTVAAGTVRIFNGQSLVAGETFTFNGSAETDGILKLFGGAGPDILTGGAGGDTLFGGVGSDRLTGNAGADSFQYGAAGESNGTAWDTIVGFNYQVDRIDVVPAITSFGATISSGALSSGSFNSDMATAMSSLLAGQARLFTPNSGGLSGRIFLVVDLNGTAGYQGGADLAIEMESPSPAIAQTISMFI